MPSVGDNLYTRLSAGFSADAVVCIESGARSVTYGELRSESARYADVLVAAGVKPGDRVAVQVPKSPEALFLYLGCVRSGATYLPLNTGYTHRELDYFVGDAEPTVVVCDPDDTVLPDVAATRGVDRVLTLGATGDGGLPGLAADGHAGFVTVQRDPTDIAAILYTSGTTGQPKGAMLTHSNLAANAAALITSWGFTSDDVLLHALPLFHTHGLFVACHCALGAGGRMILLPRFGVESVVRELPRSTVMMGVPTFYTRLLADPSFTGECCSNIRLFTSGSAPLLPQTFVEFEERTGQVILERYGMSESGMNTSNPLDGERRAGTVGFPLPGVDVRIVDDDDVPVIDGEVGGIQLRGDNVFAGYWRKPEKTAAEFTDDGWFRSGDLGTRDPDGYISIVGRGKDLVITGGFNVYPKEVEFLIDQIAGVLESAVIGIPHPDFGEAVVAVIVADPDLAEPPSEAELIAALRTDLAAYKLPKRVHVVDELPRNVMGKVQKNALRDQFGSKGD